MREVEVQQAVRVEVQPPKRRGDTRGIKKRKILVKTKLEEIGFVPSASSEPRGASCTLVRQSMQ